MPARIVKPPTTWSTCRCSDRIRYAKTAATNGWMFANSVARDGPTRLIAVNQSTFVSASGPTIANARQTQTSQPSEP